MTTWFLQQVHAAYHALKRLLTQPLGTLLSAMVVGIALSLPSAGYILLDNLSALAKGVSGTPEISLFMARPSSEAALEKIRNRLQNDTRIASFQHIPPEQALTRLARRGLGDALAGLDHNPLPHAFVATPSQSDPALYEQLQTTFRAWPSVVHVQLDNAWLERLHALLQLGKSVVILLAALLGAALIVVTFNTIRLQIMTQRREIDVSRLLGATDPFIRRPFYWFGILQGMLGGAVALLAVEITVYALRNPVENLAETYGAVFSLEGPDTIQATTMVIFAGLLGWLGSAISVRKHLSRELQ